MSERAPFLTPVRCPRGAGTLTALHVEVGQHVAVQNTLGAMKDRHGTGMPILSPYSGRVVKILMKPGQRVSPGPLLLLADARDAEGRDMSKGGPFCWHLMRWVQADRKRSGLGMYDPIRHIVKGLHISDEVTVWKWVSDVEHPSEEQLVALAALLGASQEELEAARQAIATFPPHPLNSRSQKREEG